MAMATISTTHEIFNQPPPLEGFNLFHADLPLREAVEREGGHWGAPLLETYGHIVSTELMPLGVQANENPPQLHTHDRFGHRIDQVAFHPAYHTIMERAMEHQIHCLPWTQPEPGAHVVRAALSYLHCQAEAGTQCPLTMTFASFAALRHQPEVLEAWNASLCGTYDQRFLPRSQKQGITLGMAMTEKQGGSDVRANTTTATPLDSKSGPGGAYEIVGHKWFCSAPMCDGFLILAHSPGGLSCFLVPRWRPDDTPNPFHLQRLKDKLGNRSNASSEVEFPGTYGVMIGEEGRGVRTIIDMVSLTRFDCILGSSALMRQALSQALHHTQHRSAFGRVLWEQPLMRNVLADLCLESEAALALSMRLARALDESEQNPAARALVRLVTAVGKYWVCKRTVGMINEAQECLGGAGYVEETILPRLLREAPLNSIWEGCANIQCLDLGRVMAKEPEALEAYWAELELAAGQHEQFDQSLSALKERFAQQPRDADHFAWSARALVGSMATALQAALLLRGAPPEIADAYCRSRLPRPQALYGQLPEGLAIKAILERNRLQF